MALSDVLSDAGEAIIREVARYPDAYHNYNEKIGSLLSAIDQLRAELDTPPADTMARTIVEQVDALAEYVTEEVDAATRSAQDAVNRAYDASSKDASRAATWNPVFEATLKKTPRNG